MNYWWRLYAHLAPILPDTALLSRVVQRARAAATPYVHPKLWVTPKQVRKTFLSLYEIEDEEELRERSVLLHEEVKQLAWQECMTERAAFAYMLPKDRKIPKNYYDGLRVYGGYVRRLRNPGAKIEH